MVELKKYFTSDIRKQIEKNFKAMVVFSKGTGVDLIIDLKRHFKAHGWPLDWVVYKHIYGYESPLNFNAILEANGFTVKYNKSIGRIEIVPKKKVAKKRK